MTRRANADDWQLCDACDLPINPRWSKKDQHNGKPTPERPITMRDLTVRWIHRACDVPTDWSVIG